MFNTVFLPYYLTFCLETNESFLNTNFFSLSNQKYFSTFNSMPYVSESIFIRDPWSYLLLPDGCQDLLLVNVHRMLFRPPSQQDPDTGPWKEQWPWTPEHTISGFLKLYSHMNGYAYVVAVAIFHQFPLNLTQTFFED